MKLACARLFLALACLALPAPAHPAGAPEPYRNALASLAKGDFDEAQRWFSITRKDFSSSEEGRKALLHQTLLVVSKELAALRLASIWKEAADASRLESGESRPQRKRSQEYETKALSASSDLRQLVPPVLTLENPALTLNFEVASSGWEIDDLRGRVRKGETLDAKETERLEKGEFITNYLGLLGTVLNLPEDRLFANPYEGTVQPSVFFNALGGRLFIANRRKPDVESAKLAKACFERVLKLTANAPYDKHRMEAVDFLGKLSEGVPAKAGEVIRCPVCKRAMDPEWKYCPYDGRKLGTGK